MADKTIGQLPALTTEEVQENDLFVIEHNGAAMSMDGAYWIRWVTTAADGHGGIQSITKTSSTGTNPVVDTYTITYATTHIEGGVPVHDTSTFNVVNGIKGDTGAQTYVYIKYADSCSGTPPVPETDSDMSDTPSDWMGIYVGLDSTAPTDRTEYVWYKYKGETGTASSVTSVSVKYAQTQYNVMPESENEWQDSPPVVLTAQYFLWTRTKLTFNDNTVVTSYSVARNGSNGTGSAGESLPLMDVAGGSVGESTSFAREDHRHPTPNLHLNFTLTELPYTVTNPAITSDMRVIGIEFDTPGAILSNISWNTTNGQLALSGLMNGSTTADVDLAVF